MHLAVTLLLPLVAVGNVNLMWPLSRIQNPSGVPGATASVFPTMLDGAGGCQNFACLWFNQGCQPGCKTCSDKAGGPAAPSDMFEDTCSEPGGTMEPTLMDAKLRTYRNTTTHGDWTKWNPWRAPGHAPIASPCGLAGGGNSPGPWLSDSLGRHIITGASTPPFIRRGFDGRDVPEGPKMNWSQGSVQEVAWSMFSNRGGGYAYRLCPKSGSLTEDCFQNHHLRFASDQSWIQYGSNRSNRTAFKATRVSKGTFPEGSMWTKNPIPPCAMPDGSPYNEPMAVCPQPMFPPVLPGLFGDGPGACIVWGVHGPVEGYHKLYDSYGRLIHDGPCTKEEALNIALHFQFNIFDLVEIPKDIPTGEYVLSFRLDAEQSPQIWSQCADITITKETTSQCSAHTTCASKGLTGQCCPTSDNVFLDCCQSGLDAKDGVLVV